MELEWPEEAGPPESRRSASQANWARFIKKVYAVDPQRCPA